VLYKKCRSRGTLHWSSMSACKMRTCHAQGCQATSAKNQTDKPVMAVALRVQLFTALTRSTLYETHLAFVWMKSNSQLLVLALDGQGIYTSLNLHRQHAVDAVTNMKQTREAALVILVIGAHCCTCAETDTCSHTVKRPTMHCPWLTCFFSMKMHF